MILDLSPDPSLKELQLPFEWRYNTRKATWVTYSKQLERLIKFFGPDRRPRDIFREDVKAYAEYLKKTGLSDNTIGMMLHVGSSFFKFLNEIGVVEEGYNPFMPAVVRRVRIKKF